MQQLETLGERRETLRWALRLAARCLLVASFSMVGPATSGQAGPPHDGGVVGVTEGLEIVPRVGARRATAVWRQTLRRPGAAFLKLRFSGFALRHGDRLEIRDGGGQLVETLEGLGPAGTPGRFWSLAVPGERVELVLTIARPYPRPPFRIDRLVVGSAFPGVAGLTDPGGEAATKTVCGAEDFDDVICSQGDAAEWAALQTTVGILSVGDDPGDEAIFCTGVNLSPRNAVLTSSQCLADASACQNAEFVFGYWRTGCNDGSPTSPWQGFRCGETLVASPFGTCEPTAGNLDFSLHAVVGEPTSLYSFARTDAMPLVSGEGLYLAQHAAGRPLEVSRGSGGDVVVDGLTLRYFGSLDTEPGSTGGPIFRQADDRLVGLHHCGGCDVPELGNRGVPMSAIEPLIAEHLCTDAVVLEPVAPDLVSIQGNGDGVVDPGETWAFLPRVRNMACDTAATGVTASFALAAGSAPVELLDTVADFGSLGAGALGQALAPLRFRLASDAPCMGEVALDLLALEADGLGPFPGQTGYARAPVGAADVALLLSEDFAAGIPGDWTVVDGGATGGPAATWTTDNPGARDLPLAEPFAIADSDAFGPGGILNEELVTPQLDVGTATAITLGFRHVFEHLAGGGDEQGDIDVRSSLTGGSWVNVANFSNADAEGDVSLDLSAQAVGTDDLQIRFHYYQADFDFYWAVDDITLMATGAPLCHPYDPLFTDGFESGDTSAWSGGGR